MIVEGGGGRNAQYIPIPCHIVSGKSTLTSSDLTVLFNNEMLSYITSLSCFPATNRLLSGERTTFSGLKTGIGVLQDEDLRNAFKCNLYVERQHTKNYKSIHHSYGPLAC